MPRSDWTVAVADGLCQRIQTCTSCGQSAHGGQLTIWNKPQSTLALTVARCPSCLRSYPQGVALAALLRQRYGG
jgi:hypothetical protein